MAREGRIAQVFSGDDKPSGVASSESVDLAGAYLAPGMIDIHIHGSNGVDVLESDSDSLFKLSEFLLGEGITGYFATLVPTDESGYAVALNEITSYIDRQDEPVLDRQSRGRARSLAFTSKGRSQATIAAEHSSAGISEPTTATSVLWRCSPGTQKPRICHSHV